MPRTRTDLAELLEQLGINDNEWDLILLGDGSGSSPDLPGGWACFAVEKIPDGAGPPVIKYHRPVWGAVSAGPINWLETMPYWHFLRHHYHYLNGRALCAENANASKIRTHIVTDSEWTADTMSGRGRPRYHRDMRMLFQVYSDWGYDLQWHHTRRETIVLQALADRLSAQAREYLQATQVPPEFEDEYEN